MKMRRRQNVSERVSKLRRRRRDAGLIRVEVVVPIDQADALRAYAAQLRDGSKSERMEELRKLIAKAYDKYRAKCLDNIDIKPEKADFADAAIVAAALMNRGGAEAFKLGRQINQLAR